MQEVYQKKTLHRLVGVSPLLPPTLPVNGANGKPKSKSNGKESRARTPAVYDRSTASGSGSNGKANGQSHSGAGAHAREESVRDAWAEADMVMSDDDERPAADELEGRYAIGASPPKIRRKSKRLANAHVVTFTADSDDSDSEDARVNPPRPSKRSKRSKKERLAAKGKLAGAPNGVNGSEPLRIKGMGSRSSSSSSLSSSTKRDYWLSKGVGLGEAASDD